MADGKEAGCPLPASLPFAGTCAQMTPHAPWESSWPSPRGSHRRSSPNTSTARRSGSAVSSVAIPATPATRRRSSGPASRPAGTAGPSPPAPAISTCSGRATCPSRRRRSCAWVTATGSTRRSPTRSTSGTRRRSHVTTTIHYFDRPGDVFEYGVDSLPLLLAALRTIGADDLVERHRAWLEARDRPLRRDGRRPADRASSAPTGRTAPIATRSSTGRTRTATRWSRCWPRPSRRPAGSPRRSSAISTVTTVACSWTTSGRATISAMRSTTRRSRARPTCGRSTPGVIADPAIVGPALALPRRQRRSATRIRCATRRSGGPIARSG